VYYEDISSGPGGWGRAAAAAAGAKHSYIHIQTPSADVTIEMEGPAGHSYGNLVIRDFDSQRWGLKSTVKRPCPDGNYSFEYSILDEFLKYYETPLLLPDYAGLSQNSNAFTSYLINSQGGSIDEIPFMAWGYDTPFSNSAFRFELVAPEVVARQLKL
jgi:hypothetical protein